MKRDREVCERDLIYEDRIKVSSWRRSLPLIIIGFTLIPVVYFLMPFPEVSLYNLLFSIAIGVVIIALGGYFHIKYKFIRLAVTEKQIIIENGLEKKIIPLEKVTAIKKVDELTSKRKLALLASSGDKIITALIRDRNLLEIYQEGALTAVITPVDNDEFIKACGFKRGGPDRISVS